MSHLNNFLELRERSAPASVISIREKAMEFVSHPDFISRFNFIQPQTSILMGQVQSGKTGHYLGIAAAVADKEPERLPIFILLTQRLIALQQQTYMEAKQLLTTFDVFDENDIYVEILVDYKSNSAKFSYTVINDEMYSNPITYSSRRYAELAAIEQAFKLLENL